MDSTSGTSGLTGLLKHTTQFHSKPPEPHTSTYTVFHGSPTFAGTERPPEYMRMTGTFTAPHSPSGFTPVAQKFSIDGKPTYKWGGSTGARSIAFSGTHSPYARGVPRGGVNTAASPYGGTERFNDLRYSSSTLGSTGLPPIPYKSYLAEYADEYREPKEHLDTLHALTTKFNTTGGTRVTKRSIRSDGEPKYETRVVAF